MATFWKNFRSIWSLFGLIFTYPILPHRRLGKLRLVFRWFFLGHAYFFHYCGSWYFIFQQNKYIFTYSKKSDKPLNYNRFKQALSTFTTTQLYYKLYHLQWTSDKIIRSSDNKIAQVDCRHLLKCYSAAHGIHQRWDHMMVCDQGSEIIIT